MTPKDWKQDPIGIHQGSKNTCFRPKIDHQRSKKWRWNWKISKFWSHNGNFRSELSKILTHKDWKPYPNGIYQISKIYMFQTHNWSWKIQKNADEVEKSLNSALIMAVSHLNWAKKLPQKDWKQYPFGIYHESKNTCFRPKIDHERSKKSRWSRKIIKLCSHNGSFRSELSKTMTQKDWKQYPFGIYHESKNTCFRPKIDHERSKKWRWIWKIIKFCSHNGSFRSELNSIMTQKDWKHYPNGIYQGSKSTCFRPKIDPERSKKCRWSRKIIKLCSHKGSFRSELKNIMTQKDWKQDPIGIYQGSKNTCFRPKIDHQRSKKNADEIEKAVNFVLIMAISDLNWAK